jgi:hypothetical protein
MAGQEQWVKNEDFSSLEQNSTVPFSVIDGGQNKQELKELKRSNIVPFRRKEIEFITLNEWLQGYHTNDQLQNLFVNMDIAMKYIHNQGYYISSFALDRVTLLNQSIRQIKFQDLAPLPYDISEKKRIVRDNIFMSAVLQVGLYAKCLQHFTMNTIPSLKENFQDFSIFLPPEDVPYYSGIIEKGASVYYSEYVGERKKRDLQNLEKEVSSNSGESQGKSLVKTNGTNYTAEDFLPHNEEANEIIYASLARKEAAFARALIYPVLVFVLGFVVLFLAYLLR